jgi:hypothetical protein
MYCEYLNWKQRGRGQYGGIEAKINNAFMHV